MATMIKEMTPELFTKTLSGVFQVEYEALAQNTVIPQLFNVQGSAAAFEKYEGVGALGEWGDADVSGTGIEEDTFDELYPVTYTHSEFAKKLVLKRSWIDDNNWLSVQSAIKKLAVAGAQTREIHAASVFNNAFSSSYAGGDAVELCDASHPLNPNTGGTHGNYGTSALSYDAVNDTRELMMQYVDDRGNILPSMADTLLVPPGLAREANEIAKSAGNPDTADRADNYAKSWLKQIIVWPYLTDSNNWFLIDSTKADTDLLWFDRVTPEIIEDPAAPSALKRAYTGYMRYSYGWNDWRWVYGHNVS